MKLAIDARELAGKATGVGRYLAELLKAWTRLPGAGSHEMVVCAPEPVPLPSSAAVSFTLRTAGGGGTLWEQWALPRLAADADVLFAPAYTGPVVGRMPMVVTIHDVSFAAHPEWFSWREGTRRRLLTRLSARRAAKVITVSDFSKREIVRLLGVPSSLVEVIYSGVTSWPEDAASVRLKPDSNGTIREPLVLFVGSLFNRRHIVELIDGFARVAHRLPSARLEIVGDNRTRPHVDVEARIAASGAADRIRARSYVPDAELASLYTRASAFAFFSEYEGFAFTPLEALAAGVPVTMLDTEVAREIYGPAALYVARPDPVLIAQAVERLLIDGTERQDQLSAAAAQLERYSWHECAQRTLQVLLAAGAKR